MKQTLFVLAALFATVSANTESAQETVYNHDEAKYEHWKKISDHLIDEHKKLRDESKIIKWKAREDNEHQIIDHDHAVEDHSHAEYEKARAQKVKNEFKVHKQEYKETCHGLDGQVHRATKHFMKYVKGGKDFDECWNEHIGQGYQMDEWRAHHSKKFFQKVMEKQMPAALQAKYQDVLACQKKGDAITVESAHKASIASNTNEEERKAAIKYLKLTKIQKGCSEEHHHIKQEKHDFRHHKENDEQKARMLDDEADVWQHKSDLEGIDSHHEGIKFNTLHAEQRSLRQQQNRYVRHDTRHWKEEARVAKKEWDATKKTSTGSEDDESLELWDGQDVVHASKGTKCLQLKGAMIRDGNVDDSIAKKFEPQGIKLEEGDCASSGFTSKMDYSKSSHGVTITIWEN